MHMTTSSAMKLRGGRNWLVANVERATGFGQQRRARPPSPRSTMDIRPNSEAPRAESRRYVVSSKGPSSIALRIWFTSRRPE